ncbi:MAG: threonylcarbamoyl-AMP synthase [Hyphomicrobiaceae bacterium]|nr:threonylcarbamoyl-AMP synthase [Hyphomicrobiaceae bacterium]
MSTHTTRLIDARSPSDRADAAQQAAGILDAGGIVGLGTETVYGLAGDAANGEAVARIYAAKGRPRFNPLIIHVLDLAMARREARFPEAAERLAAAFWPGPLTLVLPARDNCSASALARAGHDSIAIRRPGGFMADVIAALGRPLVAPSANRSGHVSATTAADVLADLGGRIDAVVDSGGTDVGVESTILDLTGPVPCLLRPGGIAREALEAHLGMRLATAAQAPAAPKAPGMLSSHYAPRAGVRLNATEIRPGEAYLGFGGQVPEGPAPIAAIDLSPEKNLIEAAARLFQALRRLDETGARSIAVAPIPDHGLGEAINDRLERAAAPRPAAE